MRIQQLIRVPAMAAVAVIGLGSAGCGNNNAKNEMSTDVNLNDDAAADDVLGANEAAANNSAAP